MAGSLFLSTEVMANESEKIKIYVKYKANTEQKRTFTNECLGLLSCQSQQLQNNTSVLSFDKKEVGEMVNKYRSSAQLQMNEQSTSEQKNKINMDEYYLADKIQQQNNDIAYAVPSSMKAQLINPVDYSFKNINTKSNLSLPENNLKPELMYSKQQWNLTDEKGIGIDSLNAANLIKKFVSKPADVTVAVIDSGLDLSPSLDGKKRLAHNIRSDSISGRDYDGYYFLQGSYYNGHTQVTDQVFASSDFRAHGKSDHGMHVAGIVTSAEDNIYATASGIENIKVKHVKIFPAQGEESIPAIHEAVMWTSGLNSTAAKKTDHPARVINLSLSFSRYNKSMDIQGDFVYTDKFSNDEDWNVYKKVACQGYRYAFNKAVKKGATIVLAAGNNGQNISEVVPAGCANINAIVVESTGPTGKLAYYSNYSMKSVYERNPLVVKAPGGDARVKLPTGQNNQILSVVNSVFQDGKLVPQYGFKQGTSMAAPHVSGIIALMLSANPNLTHSDIKDILIDSRQSTGVISAKKAVQGAISSL